MPYASRIARANAQTAATIRENNTMNTSANTAAYQAYAQKTIKINRPRGYDRFGIEHTIAEVVMYKLVEADEHRKFAINCFRKAERENNVRLKTHSGQLSFWARMKILDAIDDMRFIVTECDGITPNWEYLAFDVGLIQQGNSYIRTGQAVPLCSDTQTDLEEIIVDLVAMVQEFGNKTLKFSDIKPPANNLPTVTVNLDRIVDSE